MVDRSKFYSFRFLLFSVLIVLILSGLVFATDSVFDPQVEAGFHLDTNSVNLIDSSPNGIILLALDTYHVDPLGDDVYSAYSQGCVVGDCMVFDGDDSHIDFGDVLDSELDGSSSFTVMGWIYHDQTQNALSLIDNFAASNGGMRLRTASNGKIYFEMRNSANDYCTLSTSVPSSAWFHVAAVYHGTNIELYLDGVLQDIDTTNNCQFSAADPTSLYSGYMPNNNIYGEGSVDEIKIWQRDLSSSEINAIYTDESQGTSSSYDASSLLFNVEFSKADGNIAVDSTGNYDGQIVGHDRFSYRPNAGPNSGGAYKFTESSQSSIVPTISDASLVENYTWAGWVNVPSGDISLITSFMNGNDNGNFIGYRESFNSPVVSYRDSFNDQDWCRPILGIGDWQKDQWHHLVVVQNSTDFLIYIDGNLQDVHSDCQITNGLYPGTTMFHSIGYTYGDFVMPGMLSEIYVFSEVLDENEISILYGGDSDFDGVSNQLDDCPSIGGEVYPFDHAEGYWGCPLGDSNGDGVVNSNDWSTIKTQIENSYGETITGSLVDFNQDGKVSFGDIIALVQLVNS